MKRNFLIIGLFIIFQIKARCFSGIVFWEYDKKETYDIITAKNYNELIKEKACSVFVSFDKCLKYDKEVLEFYYPDEEIMNTKIQLRDYDIGNAYFSVVVNNEIVLTGLNRLGYFGAKMLKEDSENVIYICWIGVDIKRFKLTTDYTAAFNMCLDQEEDLKKICTKKIDDYFLKE